MISQILIDGIDFTNDVGGLDEFKVTYALDESTKTVNIGISNGLIFIGEAFDYLEAVFFDGTEAGRRFVKNVSLTDDCCDTVYVLTIRGDLLEYCPDICEIRTQGFSDTKDLQLYDRMRSKLISSGYQLKTSPQMRVCVDSGFFGTALFIMIDKTLDFFDAIANGIASFTGIVAIQDSLNALRARLLGCNAFIDVFSVRDLLESSLGTLGITLNSTILQGGVYSNTHILHRAYDYTIAQCNSIGNPDRIEETITQTLESLSIAFNADYRINNGVLTFERKDYFIESNKVLIDITEAEGSDICYSFTDVQNFASGKFSYIKDKLDPVSNRGFDNYFDRVEWNDNPINRFQVGVLDVEVPYAPAAFTLDEFNQSDLDKVRPAGLLKLDDRSDKNRELDKLIVLEPQDLVNDPDWCNAKAVSCPNGTITDYNWPMYFKENYQKPELYQNFYSIENPIAVKNSIYSIDTFEFVADCEQMQLVIDNGTDLNIITPFGVGIAENIELNFSQSRIKLTNIEIFK